MNKAISLILTVMLASNAVQAEQENPYLSAYYAGACYVLEALKKDNKEQAEKIKAFRDIDFYLTKCDEYKKIFEESNDRYNNKH